jgi:Ca-activated chloride channel family protein
LSSSISGDSGKRKTGSVVSRAVAFLAAWTFQLAVAVAQNPAPAFRASVRTVAVYATVQDERAGLVLDLTRDDFQILDDGREVPITTFSRERVPFVAALLLDMSSSMVPDFFRVHAAARAFIRSLEATDRLLLGTFGREVAVSPILTSDKPILERVLDEEVWPIGGGTPLWRAMNAGLGPLASIDARRVLIVVSDGRDSGGDFNCAPLVRDPRGAIGPCPGRGDVERQVLAREFMVYAIGLERSGLDSGLLDLVAESGGGSVTIGRGADLAAALQQVADELHHQYVLGFTPEALDGRTHRVDVRVTRPGVRARARKSYMAGDPR